MPDRPLLTFALIAFNQERYIREAVAGALAQTYEPLEIILSDDCSPDRTFALMEEMASVYQGPHRVRLNRNQSNLGLAGHVNRIMDIALGELIVAAAGDDVSEPDRTLWAVETWDQSGRQASSITSGISVLQEAPGASFRERPFQNQNIEDVIVKKGPSILGCSHVWHRVVFDVFGPLPSSVVAEDRAIAFRSMLLGGIAYDPRKAVRYRVHDRSLSRSRQATRGIRHARHEGQVRFLKARISCLDSFELDLRRATDLLLLSAERGAELLGLLRRERNRLRGELSLYSPDFYERIRACLVVWAGNPGTRRSLGGKLLVTLRALAPTPSTLAFLDKLETSIRSRTISLERAHSRENARPSVSSPVEENQCLRRTEE